VQNLAILNPARHLPHQQIVPDGIEVDGQIQIDHLRLAPEDGLRHPRQPIVRCPLRSIPVRPIVKPASKIGAMMSLSTPWTARSRADCLPVVIRNLYPPVPQRPVGACGLSGDDRRDKAFKRPLL
jgi:hypothetical protein